MTLAYFLDAIVFPAFVGFLIGFLLRILVRKIKERKASKI